MDTYDNTPALSGLIHHEKQVGQPWWIWLLISPVIVFTWWAFVQQILLGVPFGSNSGSDTIVLVLWILCGIALPLFVYALRVVIDVTEDEVRWKLFPIMRGRIRLSEIASAEAATYRPMRDFGGWGYRWTPWAGTVISVHGNRGVQIIKTSGRKVLLASDEPEQLADVINDQRARLVP